MMGRREFITLLSGATAWPVGARAQKTDRIRRVGLITNFSERDPEVQTRVTAFRNALHEHGWVEGVTLRLDYRYSEGDVDRLQVFALELTALAPDVLHSIGSPSTTALKDATS